MAVQVIDLPVQPASYGLADLGASIAAGAQGYAQTKREQQLRAQQLADQATARSQYLQDVGSSRDFETQRDATNRANARSDEDYRSAAQQRANEMHEKGELKTEITKALVNNGYLSPDHVDDPAAVKTAWAAAQHDGLIQKYSDLVTGGYLKIDQIGDPKAVADAQASAAAASVKSRDAAAANKAAGFGAAGNVQTQIATEQAKVDALKSKVDAATAAAQNPPAQEIQNTADQLAIQEYGPNPSNAQRSQMMEQAAQKVSDKYAILAARLDSQAKVFIPEHLKIIQGLESRAGQFEKANIFALPSDDSQDVPDAAAPAAPTSAASSAAAAALRAKLAGGNPSALAVSPAPAPSAGAPSPTTPSAFQALPNADNDTLIAQANADRVKQTQQAAVQDYQANTAPAYDQTLDQIQQVQSQITNLRNPSYGPGFDDIPEFRGTPYNTQTRAQALIALNAKLASLQTQLQQRKRKMLGVPDNAPIGMPATASATAVPAYSDSSGAMPTPPPSTSWWANPSTMTSAVDQSY